jgi:ectoine hydrolase
MCDLTSGRVSNLVWAWAGRQGRAAHLFYGPVRFIGYPDHYVQSSERLPIGYLAAQLTDRGLAKGLIAVEMDNYWFSAAAYMTLHASLPNAQLTDATGLVNWQRAVKSEAEQALMRQAGQIVGRMHEQIVEKVEPGIRKCDLVADIYDAALRYDSAIAAGGDYPALVPLLPSGADASAPHLT